MPPVLSLSSLTLIASSTVTTCGLAALDQSGNVAEDAAVVVPIEIAVGHDVADLVEGAVVDQEAPEHRLLCVDRMRRNLEIQQLGFGGGLRYELGHESA